MYLIPKMVLGTMYLIPRPWKNVPNTVSVLGTMYLIPNSVVFTGDKFTYINAAKECTIPSFKVLLCLNMDDGSISAVIDSVDRYTCLE